MKRVLILAGDDWVVIYIDGKSVEQGHTINPMYLLKLAEENNFTYSDVHYAWADSEDEENAGNVGQFPNFVEELKGKYL